MSAPSLRSKNKRKKKPTRTRKQALPHVSFLLGLFFYPEDGGDVFLRKVTFSEMQDVTLQRIELTTVFVIKLDVISYVVFDVMIPMTGGWLGTRC
jgi:hypothetical protein